VFNLDFVSFIFLVLALIFLLQILNLFFLSFNFVLQLRNFFILFFYFALRFHFVLVKLFIGSFQFILKLPASFQVFEVKLGLQLHLLVWI
jgi:hypothetical protein